MYVKNQSPLDDAPMRAVATILCLLFISGCGGLIINKDDDGGTKGAKVATRAVLGVGTLGISELYVAKAKINKEFQEFLESLPPKEREFERLLHSLISDESRRSYIRSLPPEQRTQLMTQLIVEKERQEAAAAQAASSAILQGIMSRPPPQPTTTIITPKSTNCYTTYGGGFAQTHCN